MILDEDVFVFVCIQACKKCLVMCICEVFVCNNSNNINNIYVTLTSEKQNDNNNTNNENKI